VSRGGNVCRASVRTAPAPKGRRRGIAFLLLTLWVAAAAPGALADVFHLKTGGTIDGLLLDTDADCYRLRTAVGIVRVPISSVERIEEKPSPFAEYDRRAREAADIAEDQTALALWCDEQGLKAERRKHLLRAIELDPDYAPARRALGYVRVGALWVDGRRVVGRAPESQKAEDAGPANPEQLARAIQGQWFLRIRAIKQSLLGGTTAQVVQEGRARILEIKDPLAILPLSEVLSEGDFDCRALLVEALSKFPEDEATLNLAVLGLVDPEAGIRRQAIAELARRKDPRVTTQYRDALRRGSDVILARAAIGLGQLGVSAAVPDLIDALTAGRNKWVEVPVERCLLGWPLVFSASTIVHLGAEMTAIHPPQVGVRWGLYNGGLVVGDTGWRPSWQFRYVTVYRTEVLEALKQLTGQNFGFERKQWRRWYQENRP
jgi:hypothetical protein